MSCRNTIPLIIFFLLLPCNSPAFDLHYDLSIANPSSGKGNIQIAVSNFHQDIIEIGTFATYEIPKRNVFNVTAFDSEGNSLPLTKKPGNPSFLPNNTDIWEIQTLGFNEITINYEFQPTKGLVDWRTDPIYFGYISEKFAVFLAEWVLLIPGRNYQFESFSVSFHMPANWKTACPWPKQGNIYFDVLTVFENEVNELAEIIQQVHLTVKN